MYASGPIRPQGHVPDPGFPPAPPALTRGRQAPPTSPTLPRVTQVEIRASVRLREAEAGSRSSGVSL